jgi:hypothetical protein
LPAGSQAHGRAVGREAAGARSEPVHLRSGGVRRLAAARGRVGAALCAIGFETEVPCLAPAGGVSAAHSGAEPVALGGQAPEDEAHDCHLANPITPHCSPIAASYYARSVAQATRCPNSRSSSPWSSPGETIEGPRVRCEKMKGAFPRTPADSGGRNEALPRERVNAGEAPNGEVIADGRWRTRTADLLLVRQAL